MTPVSLQSSLGQVIRSIRRQRGLRQEDLAGYSGLARTTIVAVEAGTYAMTLKTLTAISHGLGVKAWELVYKAEHNSKRVEK